MAHMAHITKITAETFEAEVLRSEIPVLIDLYADWCGPCRMMSPVLERLAGELDGRVKIVKIDTDAEPDLAAAFQVSSIPMLVMMHRGEAIDGSVGMVSRQRIMQMVDAATTTQPATRA